MSRDRADNIFATVLGIFVLLCIGTFLAVAWFAGYWAASAEWCAHIGGTYIDEQCYEGDMSPVNLGSGQD